MRWIILGLVAAMFVADCVKEARALAFDFHERCLPEVFVHAPDGVTVWKLSGTITSGPVRCIYNRHEKIFLELTK